jgi:hypothetical protein
MFYHHLLKCFVSFGLQRFRQPFRQAASGKLVFSQRWQQVGVTLTQHHARTLPFGRLDVRVAPPCPGTPPNLLPSFLLPSVQSHLAMHSRLHSKAEGPSRRHRSAIACSRTMKNRHCQNCLGRAIEASSLVLAPSSNRPQQMPSPFMCGNSDSAAQIIV